MFLFKDYFAEPLRLSPKVETQQLFVTPSWVEGSPHSENAKLNSSGARALVFLPHSI